jgi:hypothetical protein
MSVQTRIADEIKLDDTLILNLIDTVSLLKNDFELIKINYDTSDISISQLIERFFSVVGKIRKFLRDNKHTLLPFNNKINAYCKIDDIYNKIIYIMSKGYNILPDNIFDNVSEIYECIYNTLVTIKKVIDELNNVYIDDALTKKAVDEIREREEKRVADEIREREEKRVVDELREREKKRVVDEIREHAEKRVADKIIEREENHRICELREREKKRVVDEIRKREENRSICELS